MGELSKSVRLKLDRADEHAESLKHIVMDWRNPRPYRFVTEEDPDSDRDFKRYRHVIYFTRDLPYDTIRGLLGDFLHNYRCVLDHLIWELSIAHSGDPPPRARSISFPAYDDRTKYRGQGLHAVHPDVRAEVERFQPYHGGKNAWHDPLWLLCELSNIDKHRSLHVIGHYAKAVEVTIDPPVPGTDIDFYTGALEHGTVVARITVPRLHWNGEQVRVNFLPFHDIAVGDTPRTPPEFMPQVIEGTRYLVQNIADRLRHYLP